MASEPSSQGSWQGRETLSRFLRDLGFLVALLAAGLLLYHRHVESERKVRALGLEVRELLIPDAPASYAEAEKRLVAMTELDPDHPYAVATLAELYLIRWLDLGFEQDRARALEWAPKAAKLSARLEARFGATVLAPLAEGKAAEAEKLAREIVAKDPSAHALNALGRACRQQGRVGEARVALKRAAESDWRSARFACDLGDLLLDTGDFAAAAAAYGKALEVRSDHARANIGRARAHIALGQQLDAAKTIVDHVVDLPLVTLGPRVRAQALVARAELQLREGKSGEALKTATDATKIHAAGGWSQLLKARALAATGETIGVKPALDEAVRQERYAPRLYIEGAEALVAVHAKQQALELMEAGAQALPEEERLAIAHGRLLARLGEAERALARLEKAVALNELSAQAHFEKAVVLLESKKDLEGAEKALTAAVEIQETFPEAYVRLGDVLFAGRRWADGCQQYAQALLQQQAMRAPVEQAKALRERVRARLVGEAKQAEMAKAWMDETAGFVR